MRLIKSKVENITPQRYLEKDILKHIELCGKTCYKSENNITDDSYKRFVDMIKTNHHNSVLEHGTVYLFTTCDGSAVGAFNHSIAYKYSKNPYSIVKTDGTMDLQGLYITTNYRVIVENGWEEDLKYLVDEPIKPYHVERHTFRITCSRAIANEIVRHRQMSFSQESTRYCNYSKEKFGSGLTYIIPEKLNMLKEGNCYLPNGKDFAIEPFNGSVWDIQHITSDHFYDPGEINEWLNSLYRASESYLRLLEYYNWKPEEARGVLPLDLKTELIVTGTTEQWHDFFKLRCAKSAHPDIQKITNDIKQLIYFY